MNAPERAVVPAIDHDRLFKELLTAFFVEFLDLFFPQEAELIDRDSIEFLPQEVFVRIGGVETRRVVDLLVKVRLKGDANGPGLVFLIHIEHQSTVPPDVALRLFEYNVALSAEYKLPVFPIVIFSHDRPRTRQPGVYRVKLLGRKLIEFRCPVVQLNRLSWRRFVKSKNPVATALLVKMNVAPKDRVRVKWECIRSMAGMSLGPKQTQAMNRFVDAYLRLNEAEEARFDRKVAKMPSTEQEQVTEYMTSWELKGFRKGRQEGLTEGLEEGRREALRETLLDVVAARFGAESAARLAERVGRVQSVEELRGLTRRALVAVSLAELDA